MKIPKYIITKIEKQNKLVYEASELQDEILDWYDRKCEILDPDNEILSEYCCDPLVGMQANGVSLECIQDNLDKMEARK